jgi:hypothetical protein
MRAKIKGRSWPSFLAFFAFFCGYSFVFHAPLFASLPSFPSFALFVLSALVFFP